MDFAELAGEVLGYLAIPGLGVALYFAIHVVVGRARLERERGFYHRSF
jgi:hypothetical protein